jgi:hypothetical protein
MLTVCNAPQQNALTRGVMRRRASECAWSDRHMLPSGNKVVWRAFTVWLVPQQ